jgi:hypothetical protein
MQISYLFFSKIFSKVSFQTFEKKKSGEANIGEQEAMELR